MPRGWSGRFNPRDFARARQEQGERAAHLQPPGGAAARPVMEPVRERPDKKVQNLEPNRPEEWTLDGVVVGTMNREQCRVAELPVSATQKNRRVWGEYLRRMYPEDYTRRSKSIWFIINLVHNQFVCT